MSKKPLNIYQEGARLALQAQSRYETREDFVQAARRCAEVDNAIFRTDLESKRAAKRTQDELIDLSIVGYKGSMLSASTTRAIGAILHGKTLTWAEADALIMATPGEEGGVVKMLKATLEDWQAYVQRVEDNTKRQVARLTDARQVYSILRKGLADGTRSTEQVLVELWFLVVETEDKPG